MFCPKCGTPNKTGDRFCANCGAALIANTVPAGNPVNGGYNGAGINGSNPMTGAGANGGINGSNPMTGAGTNGGINGSNPIPGAGTNGGINGSNPISGAGINGGFYSAGTAQAPSKKISKRTWIIAAEIVVIVVLAFVFQMNAKKEYSPESVAERYFLTYTQGDLKDVYKYIDAGEGDFLCENTFETAVNLNDNSIRGDISNYSVFVKENDGYRATVQVTYQTKSGGNNDRTMSMTLKKTGNKKLLFFDEWAVSNSFSTVSNSTICVPKGSKVTLDGIDVTKKTKAEDRSDGMTCYVIDKIYSGSHVVEVQADGFQSIKNKIELTDDDIYYTANMILTEDVVKRIAGEAVKYNKMFIENAVKQEEGARLLGQMNPVDSSAVDSDYTDFKEYLQTSRWNSDTFSYEDTSVSKAVLSDVNVSYEEGGTNKDEDYDFYTEDDTVIVGAITITENMKGSYAESDLEDMGCEITQKYYYGIKDGGIVLYSVSTSQETTY